MNPILIHKGDCTIFANVNKFLTFNLETDLDLTGWQAKFILGWVEKTIDDISTHSFEIILGAEDTKQLRLGKQHGTIILTDSNGNIKTVTNTIPFEVTTEVVENEYQEIDLTIPESSGVDIKLKVGASTVTSVNGMTGDIVGLATEQQLVYGLKTKQDKGDYALKSEIPNISNLANKDEIPTLVSELENDSNYATQTQVMQAIASIPQFKLSIVNELPSIGAKMTLYLVPKDGEAPDIYNEYIWIEETSIFEHLGSTAVDLTGYVKNTDWATYSTAGVMKLNTSYGAGLFNGTLICSIRELQYYNSTMQNASFISKGTLDNVLTQYSKTVSLTEADYEALETKDSNTLYLIEE